MVKSLKPNINKENKRMAIFTKKDDDSSSNLVPYLTGLIKII